MSFELESLLKESNSIIDLEQKLEENGHSFKNLKDYLNFLNKEWRKISWNNIDEILKSPVADKDFPSLRVDDKEVSYYIHGLVHGWDIVSAPGFHMRKKTKKQVIEKLKEFHNPRGGEDYFCEERFASHFDLQISHELKDITKTAKKLNKNPEKIFLSISSSLAGIVALPLLFSTAYLISKAIKKPNSEAESIIFINQKALTDIRYQAKSAELQLVVELPQPFNLEIKYLNQKDSWFDKFINYAMFEPDAATTPERSLWAAKELKWRARINALDTVHYICGLGHITEVAYFLKHPDYSFEALEQYRISRHS
ncbi:MAG: hypothetical protein J7J92_00915 [Candidatus Aenigmarchaeota archaeon]|nr:hypothetical protein [Candidatus Aenigmarchaeota archaeon]